MERLPTLGLIDAPLVGRYAIHVRLEVEMIVLVSLHQFEHALPVILLESHIAVVVCKGPKYLYLGQETAP